MKQYYLLLFLFIFSCSTNEEECEGCDPASIEDISQEEIQNETNEPIEVDSVSLIVLGTTQDAGSPQIGCFKDCCNELQENPDPKRMVSCLGLVDPINKKNYLFDATPDIQSQLNLLFDYSWFASKAEPDGIFLTHAHIGHYTGLMYFGKEASDAKEVPVFVMPRMKKFLENNGPWNLLIERKNIVLIELLERETIYPKGILTTGVNPIVVPHRDEYSETVGYEITGPNKTALFIPDIDKWQTWKEDILEIIQRVDYAFLDATFFDSNELPNRDMSEVPHPFVEESMELFKDLSKEDKEKVIFIHFNHTNPLLKKDSEAYQMVIDNGFRVAELGDVYPL